MYPLNLLQSDGFQNPIPFVAKGTAVVINGTAAWQSPYIVPRRFIRCANDHLLLGDEQPAAKYVFLLLLLLILPLLAAYTLLSTLLCRMSWWTQPIVATSLCRLAQARKGQGF